MLLLMNEKMKKGVARWRDEKKGEPLRMSPLRRGLLSGMPWQMTSFTDLQSIVKLMCHELVKLWWWSHIVG